jgi:hypothetical protein
MTQTSVDLSVFSDTYAQAREKFLATARASGAQIASYEHPTQRGPDGEALALDVAVLGRPDAPRVMVAGCGTHGIEGYSGSAAQVAWMRGGGATRIPPGAAMVFFHGHNPWGFAHHQRVTEEGVDLNRNFIDHDQPYPANTGYAALHPHLVPTQWDAHTFAQILTALDAFREQHGEQAFSDAYNGGQYDYADGVFYGGARAQWANTAFHQAVREHVGHARHAAIIDLHTGIGPFLDHVFLCFHDEGSAARERARRWWGERAVNLQGSTHKALARYQGLLVDAFIAALPKTETTAVVIEFGTRSRADMQKANLSLAWLRKHGMQHPQQSASLFKEYIEAFYPSDPAWRRAVLAQSRVFLDQALAGVAAS